MKVDFSPKGGPKDATARGTAKTASRSPTATPGRSSRAPNSTQRPTPPRPSAPRTSARGLERRPPDQADGGLLLRGGPSQRGRKRNRKGAAPPPTPKNIPPFFVRELKPASILLGAPHALPRLVPPEGEPPPLPQVKPRSGPALPREAPPPNPRG